MKLQTLQILQILLRHVQDHGRLTVVCVSVCLLVYVCWCVCWCVGVCGAVFVLRVGCAFRVLVLWCAVLCRYVWCWCWCWCAMCDAWCLWCVWRGLARGKTPCEGSKRLRVLLQQRFCVYRQNARMCSTCARFAGTHGSVLNLHTEPFGTYTRGASLSLLSFSLSLVLSSFSLPSFSPFVLFLFSPLSATMRMITCSLGSL